MALKDNMQVEFAPVTPGEMLKVEFLAEYGLSQNRLAKAIGISPNRIAEIVNNRRRITADTALRLGLYFGNSPEYWMNLQTHYDLKMARDKLPPGESARIKATSAAWVNIFYGGYLWQKIKLLVFLLKVISGDAIG